MSNEETLQERIAQAVIEHADHMETYTLPALQPGFIDGWTHALRLLRRDAGFIAHRAAPLAADQPAEAAGGQRGDDEGGEGY